MRSINQAIKDFFTFPIRAFTLFEKDKFGLSSLQTERYDYVAEEVIGKCLDIGCGRYNRFIKQFVKNNGIGIDVYKYDGLTNKNIVQDMTHLPFADRSFDTVTLIANINHIPKSIRAKELKEIHRILKKNGKLIITMGNPLIEILVHKVVWFYDKFFKTNVDVDTERGMEFDEEYYLTDKQIISLLADANFKFIKRKKFITQWGLNHLIISNKIN